MKLSTLFALALCAGLVVGNVVAVEVPGMDAKTTEMAKKAAESAKQLININTAKKEDLMKVPGVSDPLADQIISHRPYKDPKELLTKKVVSKDLYDKISGLITTK